MKQENKWWPEYKCAKCGYASTVTNICRKCNLSMLATGRESLMSFREDGTLKQRWRKVTKRSEFYRDAIFASHAFKVSLVTHDHSIPIPAWAYFGGEQ